MSYLFCNDRSTRHSCNRALQSGNTFVFNLRQDVFEKNKVHSQRLDSSSVLNSEPKTVIQSRYTHLLTEDSNSDVNTIDRESSLKTDSVITSTTEEKQHRSVHSEIRVIVILLYARVTANFSLVARMKILTRA